MTKDDANDTITITRAELATIVAKEVATALAEAKKPPRRKLAPLANDCAILECIRDYVRIGRAHYTTILQELDARALAMLPADLGPELAARFALSIPGAAALTECTPVDAWGDLVRAEHERARASEAAARIAGHERARARLAQHEEDERRRRETFERANDMRPRR